MTTFKKLRDIFYETRVMMGRGFTLQRFATEAMDGTVDPVMLSYIEKGKRFPTEALVNRLAQLRGQAPDELLVLLWQDRILHAFSREFRRIIKVDKDKEEGIEESEIAFLVSCAIAALPDDDSWVTQKRWRSDLQEAIQEIGKGKTQPLVLVDTVVDVLQRQGLVEIQKEKVRSVSHHYVPAAPEERRSLSMEFCSIFTKGLLEKVVRKDQNTYLRNHYLNIPKEQIDNFYRNLDQRVRLLAREYATEEKTGKKFLNVLITSTPF
jgi:hypothetical protein